MAWKIESEELDLYESEHRTVFVEESVVDRFDGKPARHVLQIVIGQPGGLSVTAKGELLDAEGKVYDHRAKQQEILKSLNDKHSAMRAFARAHNAPLTKGPKK